MKSRTAIGILALTLLMLPAAAAAQDVATSLDDLLHSRQLRPGDGVYVTNAMGKRIKGDVTGRVAHRTGNHRREGHLDAGRE